MLNLPSEKVITLIERVLAKHQWTQNRLAQELNLGPETISRWKSGTGIHKGHYEELLRLVDDKPIVALMQQENGVQIPFSVTIPRKSISVTTDANGDINIKGLLIAILDKKET